MEFSLNGRAIEKFAEVTADYFQVTWSKSGKGWTTMRSIECCERHCAPTREEPTTRKLKEILTVHFGIDMRVTFAGLDSSLEAQDRLKM
jgi:hypothetical protein